MGGVSVAGLRPGFGRGGIIHSLCVKPVEDCGVFACKGDRPLADEDMRGKSGRGVPSEVGDEALDPDIMLRIINNMLRERGGLLLRY